jgi:hypothetical protein
MDLFDTLTFAEILGRTTFLGTLSLTVLKSPVFLLVEQLRDALNNQGRLGIIYKGLTKHIVAKHGGSTTLTPIRIACLYSSTTKTIALLIKNRVQIASFDTPFHTTCTMIENKWNKKKHKLTPLQQANKQKILHKLYTFNIYIFEDLTMTNGTTLMNPNKLKKQYNSCPTIIKIALHHCQIMFCQYNTCETNCP